MQRTAVELEALDQREDLAHSEAAARRSASEISTSNCPALASTAPSFITVEVLGSQHVRHAGDGDEDVPAAAASKAGITAKPSIRASRARSGSTSQTITDAPNPAARNATPRPVQP